MPTTPSSVAVQRKRKARLLRGFADLSRLAILEVLCTGSLTVTEIMTRTGLSQSNTSNHLACLRECGLVTGSQQGRYAYYQLSDERVAAMLALVDALLRDHAPQIAACPYYADEERGES